MPCDHLIKTNELSLDQSAIIEPLSIGAHAVRRSDLQKGDFALVIGAGPIGLGVMQAAKQKGAKVIAMDMNEERLAFSKVWAKVDYAINVENGPVEQLMNITNGDKQALFLMPLEAVNPWLMLSNIQPMEES
ncbi:sorbitol dehydrogenase [Gracilibacillus boraciitolerans JCM 21714]|uniref:Sorbitol dehydrogenase n=1 Tax=Gracilibacillus boraciitolerans JCM 21714 TaxID=1298598 RepID=W4VNK9_9BACI|nr:sorbitol dehydrogenase [Gracilibacillus boraciitolerans JCM 21714]